MFVKTNKASWEEDYSVEADSEMMKKAKGKSWEDKKLFVAKKEAEEMLKGYNVSDAGMAVGSTEGVRKLDKVELIQPHGKVSL